METAPAFLSYCREDSEFAFRLAKDLKAAGANIWMDQLDIEPGTPWDDAVDHALEQSRFMLVLLSPVAVSSPNVRDEVSFALSRHKKVIPILYRDCDVPFRLARLQHVDFTLNYAQGLQTLVKALSGGALSAGPVPPLRNDPVPQPPQAPAIAEPSRIAPPIAPPPLRPVVAPAEHAARSPQSRKFPLWAGGLAGLAVLLIVVVWVMSSSRSSAGPAQPAPVTDGRGPETQNPAANMQNVPSDRAANAPAGDAQGRMERPITGRWIAMLHGKPAMLSIDRVSGRLQGELEYDTNASHHVVETLAGDRKGSNVMLAGTGFRSSDNDVKFNLDTLNLSLDSDDSTLTGTMSDKSGNRDAISFTRRPMAAKK